MTTPIPRTIAQYLEQLRAELPRGIGMMHGQLAKQLLVKSA